MSAPLLLLLLLVARQEPTSVEAALDAGDFALAWEAMEAEKDPLEQARWRTEILYLAGHPSGALDAARGGLRLAPAHLSLLFRATGAALWLQDERASAEYADRLSRAVEESDELAVEDRTAWQDLSADFLGRSKELERHAADLDRAVSRSRWISFSGLCLLLALIGWSARPAYGRSSSPVS
jgi:hypothetical protein